MRITETKDQYTPPRSEVLEMNLEGVIAASGDPKYPDTPFGGEKPW